MRKKKAMEEKRVNRRKLLTGTVVSDKMQKTRVVKVVWVAKHAKYLKQVKHMVKYKAHDEKNESKEGDVVTIMETRPISKDKRWVINEIVNQVSTKEQAK
jgi:small subunit ribosomal protein S17